MLSYNKYSIFHSIDFCSSSLCMVCAQCRHAFTTKLILDSFIHTIGIYSEQPYHRCSRSA